MASEDAVGPGFLLCLDCGEELGGTRFGHPVPFQWMPQAYDDAVDARLVRLYRSVLCGGPNQLEAVELAKWELELALPRCIDLAWPREVVVKAAVAALERYGAHLEDQPEDALLEVGRWHRCHRPVSRVELGIRREVRKRVMLERVRPKVIAAVERLTLKFAREWVFTKELIAAEGLELNELVELTGGDPEEPKSVGHLLSDLIVPAASQTPGLRQMTKRGSDGQRWSVWYPQDEASRKAPQK